MELTDTLTVCVMFQDLAGEDMLSPAAYQPRTEVAEVEMMGGVTDQAGVRGKRGRKKVSSESTIASTVTRLVIQTAASTIRSWLYSTAH